MKNRYLLFATLLLLQLFGSDPAAVRAWQVSPGRTIYLTILPNYEENTIEYDGKIVFFSSAPSSLSQVDGFPLAIDTKWKHPVNPEWNILGTFEDSKLTLNKDLYHLEIGSIELQPHDTVHFMLPYVNLDYADVQPTPDAPDKIEESLRHSIHRFSYSAEDVPEEIELKVAFSPVRMNIDLILTPLVGESMMSGLYGFRLSGKVRFDSFTRVDEFSRYCQNTLQSLEHGDYRMQHLLSALNAPYSAGSSGVNPVFQQKPTSVALRSELLSCQYEGEEPKDRFVEAAFAGRAYSYSQTINQLPVEVQALAFSNGNFPFEPADSFEGLSGYKIQLGKIVLGPGDVLNIVIPHTRILLDSASPMPDRLDYPDANREGSQIRITYVGPASFDLTLPYIPQTGLYSSQFSAALRPWLLTVKAAFDDLLASRGRWLTRTLLLGGILLLVASRVIRGTSLLSIPAWLCISVSFFYGVRGSFGLLCVAMVMYISRVSFTGSGSENREESTQRILRGLAGLAFIAVAVYADRQAMLLFRGLAGFELSPMTPLILLILVIGLFWLLYGTSVTPRSFTRWDLPVLGLLLAVPALYDAFDNSLVALLILLAAGLAILRRAYWDKSSGTRPNEGKFGNDLRRRWKLAFGNWIVLLAILALLIFAVLNDLSGTFAHEMQVLLPPLIAPLVIPLLVVVSVVLTFSSIALLFILVYPFLPFKTGYLKAAAFSLALFLVFLFGIGTDDRLIASLPDILVGRVIYYVSVPMLIGVYLDIYEFMQKENKRRTVEGEEKEELSFQAASSMYFKNLRGLLGTLVSVVSLVAPTVYAFLSSQPVMVTYFDLLEKLVSLPV